MCVLRVCLFTFVSVRVRVGECVGECVCVHACVCACQCVGEFKRECVRVSVFLFFL